MDHVARGRHWVTFSGTADQAARTFRTRFHRFQVNGQAHFANVDEPSVPSALQDVVGGFLGLNDFKPHSNVVRPQFTSSKGVHTLVPDDLAAIYNIAPLYAAGIDGTGQKIAIIGDSSLDLSDIRGFRQQFNLPFNDPIQILIGDDPGYNSDVVESNLDIEWANAVARGAQIVYLYGQDVFFTAQFAVDDNVAPVLSLSFGGCEAYNQASYRAVAQQASAQGITWLAASGDTGAAECDQTAAIPQAAKGLAVSFPASIPEITAVGGTQLDDTTAKYWSATNTPNGASALGYIPETVWNDTPLPAGFDAAGGGASILFPKPYWQTGPGVPNDKSRDIPDVSLAASPYHAALPVLPLWRPLYRRRYFGFRALVCRSRGAAQSVPRLQARRRTGIADWATSTPSSTAWRNPPATTSSTTSPAAIMPSAALSAVPTASKASSATPPARATIWLPASAPSTPTTWSLSGMPEPPAPPPSPPIRPKRV